MHITWDNDDFSAIISASYWMDTVLPIFTRFKCHFLSPVLVAMIDCTAL
ncbi:hypothetical protein M116_0809 [Bacteroides fragilis str. 3719 A10]|nr:hypothetical protein M116_0809 [Bacteroides fragilis str. 3719 A10]EYA72502.1 hypothetical protein M132_0691 [Bacteroides fragilis str. S24L15]EYA77180.1 hypothetical protein M133_0745 [Bacteroides fragilis str. S24L26]